MLEPASVCIPISATYLSLCSFKYCNCVIIFAAIYTCLSLELQSVPNSALAFVNETQVAETLNEA